MKLQLVVWHKGTHQPHYYPVSSERPWKIDGQTRQIVIGQGMPRTYIPLDNVLSYDIEEVADPC